mmetsp:Transcript_19581/g.47369  ORF Transcript_19581/g.47369 Transcript_19581/m.47369 type:complete len:112 (-) Transcript_19581:2750-3085(-)
MTSEASSTRRTLAEQRGSEVDPSATNYAVALGSEGKAHAAYTWTQASRHNNRVTKESNARCRADGLQPCSHKVSHACDKRKTLYCTHEKTTLRPKNCCAAQTECSSTLLEK